MSKKKKEPEGFASISAVDLDKVSGGAARVTARGSAASSEITAMLSSVTSSIQDLASQKSSGMDPMMMMMMMMMMGGGGGGGQAVAAPQPAQPATPPVINISTSVKGRGGCY